MRKPENYILFIDESGKSKLSDDGEHFLLSCIIIQKDLHAALSSYMVSLKERSNIPADENTHAFELFEDEKTRDRDNRRIKKRIPHAKIDALFRKLSSLIDGADMKCFFFRINKTFYKKLITKIARRKRGTNRAVVSYIKRSGLDDFLYESLARKAILEFGHFLENEDAYGEVMAESRRQDDHTVLWAFISATHESTFGDESRYRSWAKSSLKRIQSLTFQNKKGLSFGLEIADLFGWAHLNVQYGRLYPIASRAKVRRVDLRLRTINEIMQTVLKKRPEDITESKLKTIAGDRISEFTKALKEYRAPLVSSGTPPGIPGEPYLNTNSSAV